MSMASPHDRLYRRQRFVGLRRLLVVLVVLGLLVLAGYSIWNRLVREAPVTAIPSACPSVAAGQTSAASASPAPKPAAKPVPAVPPQRITVNVYNATTRVGLASGVATQLKSRGFKVNLVANDPLKRQIAAAAEIRHGPNGVATSRTVAAQIEGAKDVRDKRKSSAVDLVIGNGYGGLRTPAQAAAILSPQPGAGC